MADHHQEPPSAEHFDEAFGKAGGSRVQRVLREGLPDLPEWVESYSFAARASLAEALNLSGGGLRPLLDLACGLGGPGLLRAVATA